jgi:exodeoxyribonuclease V gamma subunit
MSALAARGSAAHHEIGNPLLSAWGKQAQSQLSLLVEASGEAALDDAHYTPNPGRSLLAQVQNSVLDMTELAPGSLLLRAEDRSLEVHVCHSLTREIEVLQNRLLGLFATQDDLVPGDVLVATPDLEAAAPLIESIFGTAPKERFIPFAISGRARSRANPAARILLELMALAASRFTASAVFGLLQQPQVARQFGLDDAQLAQIHEWLQMAGVHWALDADHRGSFALPASPRHSLADGLDRLFLGYALPTRVAEPYGGRLPAGAAEGSDALALGALWRFSEALAAWRHHSVSQPLPAPAWPGLLADALNQFLSPDDSELDDLREVHRALELLGEQFQRSGLTEPLPLDVVRTALAAGLDEAARGGVPTGTVTFAAMSSLRRLPFRVVCVIGLNDGAFPSPSKPLEFDLMAAHPRPGDRQRRHDDRNVFLDLLLAARDHVHLSYVGRSVRDNSPLPPSVLVSELLDVLGAAITPPVAPEAPDGHVAWVRAHRQARSRLVLEHPLQPFAEDAFRLESDIRLRSFHAEYAEALKSRWAPLVGAGLASAVDAVVAEHGAEAELDPGADEDNDSVDEPAAPFINGPLPEPGEEWRTVSLQQLVQFFRNPCRFLLERRLGIELRRDEAELQDDEPFVADLPSRSQLARRLLPLLIDGASLDIVRSQALGGTEVPQGAFGRRFLESELAVLQDLAERIKSATQAPCLPPHAVSLDVILDDGFAWRLHAGFADLRPSGLVRHGHDKLRAGDHLAAWLHHLVLCASPPEGVALSTTWLGRDGQIRFRRCESPLQVLQALLELYRSGLREPLLFLPKTAWAYVEKESVSAALGKWRPTKQNPHAEGADAAYRLALRGRPDPVGADPVAFRACAHAVYDPLLACLE